MDDSKVEKYYDEYTVRQQSMGINHRHLSIQRWLEYFGLKTSDSILEVGCGIGTVTELMLRYLSTEGKLLATDISDESLRLARERLAKYANVEVSKFNFVEKKLEEKFDVIVLPDVIEHIPIELHGKLFKNLEAMLTDDGFIFIHIPDPNHLEWTIRHRPDLLQIIDQPIHTELLTKSLSSTSLYINHLQSYSVYNVKPDYQVVVLNKKPTDDAYRQKDRFLNGSMSERIKKKVKFIMRGKK